MCVSPIFSDRSRRNDHTRKIPQRAEDLARDQAVGEAIGEGVANEDPDAAGEAGEEGSGPGAL